MRQEVASACALGLNLTIPVLIDAMDNRADRAFNGWPERLYVLSADRRVAYQGGKGPYGFDPDELERFLREQASGVGDQASGKAALS
jgi:hypothetical protein